jgi:hypothetical protein
VLDWRASCVREFVDRVIGRSREGTMVRQVFMGALVASVALGAGSATAQDTRSEQLGHQTSTHAHQTTRSAHGAASEAAGAARGAAGTVVNAGGTAVSGAHGVTHRLLHGNDTRSQEISAQTHERAHATGQSAGQTGRSTAGAARETGGAAVHGAQTAGSATHQVVHEVTH